MQESGSNSEVHSVLGLPQEIMKRTAFKDTILYTENPKDSAKTLLE